MSHILKIAGRRTAVRHQLRLPGFWRFCGRQGVRGAATTATAAEQVAPEETVRPFQEIPGPKGLPFIGTALDYSPFGRFPIHTQLGNSAIERYKTHGKIYREKLGPGREMVFVCDPKDIGTVFRSDGRLPERPPVNSIATYRKMRKKPPGLGNLMGEDWHRVRSSVNKEMMRPKSVGAYATMQDDVSREMAELIQTVVRKGDSGGQVDNFMNLMHKWGLESLSLVILGKRMGCLTLDQLAEDSDAQRMISAVLEFFLYFGKLEMSLPFYRYFSTPAWKKFETAMDTMNSIAEKMIGEKLTELSKLEEPPQETDFLSSLLSQKDMTLDEAVMMAIELLTGAFESTANTLAFNLYCLAKNPAAQQKLYEEIMNVVPPGQPIDDRVLNKMSYLRAVFKETSRLYPTIFFNARTLTRDVVLSGYHVPAKTQIIMANNVISTLPEYYPDPEAYIPERWLRTESSAANVQAFALLPFGYGARMCVGRRFAEQEIFLGLIRIIQKFHVGWDGEDMKQIYKIFNTPDRDTFIFRERE
ncbi:probable cytochrome P450 CYP44 [Branchiostoma floridae]|uniref:Probable cytochrome P450 CYP44 n=1 Tax=Branchiostoma floridae TaxID=7739 RepID=A0A9J7LWZ1_BRAFL|nr:probable cytochrome P450 CYP44 [Branchiostoma floridae]